MEVKIIDRTTIEEYVPQWNEDFSKIGLSDDEKFNQGYRPFEKSEHHNVPYYYEEIDGVIYELVDNNQLLNDAKFEKINLIKEYDSSYNVNQFYINKMSMWIDRDTRSSLMNSLAAEEAAGEEMTTMWANNIEFNMPISFVKQVIQDIERYAKQCYNVTRRHEAAVEKLTTIEEIKNYEHKKDYPPIIEYNV